MPWKEGVLIHIVIRVIMFVKKKHSCLIYSLALLRPPAWKSKKGRLKGLYTWTKERDEETGAIEVSRKKTESLQKANP